jgi:hypothetical protein
MLHGRILLQLLFGTLAVLNVDIDSAPGSGSDLESEPARTLQETIERLDAFVRIDRYRGV